MKKLFAIIRNTKVKTPARRLLEIYHIDKGFSEPLFECADYVVSRTSGLFENAEYHEVTNSYGVKFNVTKSVLYTAKREKTVGKRRFFVIVLFSVYQNFTSSGSRFTYRVKPSKPISFIAAAILS